MNLSSHLSSNSSLPQSRPRRVTPALVMTLTVLAVAASLGTSTGRAQQSKGPPNALQGFSSNRGTPVQIKAGSLEVRDKDKRAVFSGNVQVVQGDTTLRSKTLAVFYEGDPAKPGLPVAQGKGEGNQQVRRMEAKGGVVVNQKDQIATGDSAEFDVRANTVTLSGKVVLTQGQNVARGQRLVVDLTSGVSKLESDVGRRIEMLITPSDRPNGNSGSGLGPLARPQR